MGEEREKECAEHTGALRKHAFFVVLINGGLKSASYSAAIKEEKRLRPPMLLNQSGTREKSWSLEAQ